MADRIDRMAEAFAMAERVFPGKPWVFAKGRTRPEEPLFGFAVFEHPDDEHPLSQAEDEDPVRCVMLALNATSAAGCS